MKTRGYPGAMAIGLPVFFLILTTIYLTEAFRIHGQVSDGSIVGPKFLPVLAAIGMYVTLLWVLVSEFRKAARGDGAARADAEGGGDLRDPLLIICATGVYILLFRPLGYFLSTAAYVAALFIIFRYETGRPARFVLALAGVVLVFFGLFQVVFGVRLPPFPGMN
ncbi:MAG: tripartite tricarboxylate transporter TctB family protein [Tropicimonas sp.]|uniref:tripartite tricarboxylate transporter TctB family protein n=1 Tax=Tropicimonas sp. TaxID=2067044 RepID=UPI003A87705B